jgi:hypothetical protein
VTRRPVAISDEAMAALFDLASAGTWVLGAVPEGRGFDELIRHDCDPRPRPDPNNRLNAPLAIAHHEAGHSVVAMALGIGIRKLEVRLCHFCPRNDPVAWWAYAVMALGGPAAEQRYACYPFGIVAMKRNSVWAADYQRACDWLRRRPGVTLAAAEATARHLVGVNWLSIIRIAQALSVLGELDGAALVRVVLGDWRLRREQDALAS